MTNEKNKNENEDPIILALLIGQEAVLSLQLSRTRITNKLHECFQRCYISSCILKSLASKFSLLTDDPFLFLIVIIAVLIFSYYYTACCCSRYNARSDWLILGHYSPVMPTGRLRACKKACNKQLINLERSV